MLDSQYIAGLVLFHRKAAHLSRVELAELAGVGKTVIYDIEHGKPTVRLDTLAAVLSTLNIQADWRSPLMEAFARSQPGSAGAEEVTDA